MSQHRLRFSGRDPLRRENAPSLTDTPQRVIVDWTPAERDAFLTAIAHTLTAAADAQWRAPDDTDTLQQYLAEHAAVLREPAATTLRIPVPAAEAGLALAALPLFVAPDHALRAVATPALAQAVDHLAARMNVLHTLPEAFQLTLPVEDPTRPREGRFESPMLTITVTVQQARQTLRFLEQTESMGILSDDNGSVAEEFRMHIVANLLATDTPEDEDAAMLLAERKPTDRITLQCVPAYATRLGSVLETLWHVARHELWKPEDREAVTGCLDAVLDSVEAATGFVPPLTQTRRALLLRDDRAAMIAAGILTPDPTDVTITLHLTWPEALAMTMLDVGGTTADHGLPLFGTRIKARFGDSAAMALSGMQSGKGLQSAFTSGAESGGDRATGFLGTSTAAAELHALLPDANAGVLEYAWQTDAQRRWTLTLLAPEAWVVIAAASPQQPVTSSLGTTTKLLQIGASAVRQRLLRALSTTPGAIADRRLIQHAAASRREDVTLAVLSFGHHRGSQHPIAQEAWAMLDQARFNPLSHAVTPQDLGTLDSLTPADLPTGGAVNVTQPLTATRGWEPSNQQLIATTLLAEKAPDLAKLLDPEQIIGLRSATLFVHDGQFVVMVYLAFPYAPAHPGATDDETDDQDYDGAAFSGPTASERAEDAARHAPPEAWALTHEDDDPDDDDLDTNAPNAFAHDAYFEALADTLPMAARLSESAAHELADTWGDVLRELEAVQSLAFSTDEDLGMSYVQALFLAPTTPDDAPMTAAAMIEATSHELAAAAQTVHRELHERWVEQPPSNRHDPA